MLLFINVVHKCFELVIKHQFLKIKMVSIFHNIIININNKQHMKYINEITKIY